MLGYYRISWRLPDCILHSCSLLAMISSIGTGGIYPELRSLRLHHA